ncbi:MAG: protease modulator HflC [Verrucomicrobiota bacterium]
MMKQKNKIILKLPLSRMLIILLVVTLMLVTMFSFQVQQHESVVVTRMGKPVRTVEQAGFHFRLPWPIESLHIIERRLDAYEIRLSEALTQDKRNVILPIYVAWKVSDPLLFLKSLGAQDNARQKLDSLVTSARNSVLGGYDFYQLVSTSPEEVKIRQIEKEIKQLVVNRAKETFGVEILNIGIKRLALPESNTRFVFERMRAERSQYAAKFRAEGERLADEIRAETDTEASSMLAQAKKFAEEERGRGEAQAAKIYAEAHSKDPDFYQFLKELELLKASVDEQTVLILDSNSSGVRQLNNTTFTNSDTQE